MSIRITTLGDLEIRKDEQIVPLPIQRRALFVYLVVERDVTREEAMSVFWPDVEDSDARHNLSQGVYQLRQWLGDDWLLVNGGRLRVLSSVQLDSERFEEAVESGQHLEALQLYRGSFLARISNLPDTKPFENWSDARRARLERLHRRVRRAQIDAAIARTDCREAIRVAREWVALSPAEDEAQHRLIEILATCGEPTEAIRQFELYERLLANDDLEPLDETRALVASIRRADLTTTARITIPTVEMPPGAGRTDPSSDLEVVRLLGEGSVARVFLAREHSLKRLVAVKVLREELAENEITRQRFEREAHAAASVSHPNIAAIHRITLWTNGTPCIVMEYIDGRTLDDLLVARGTLNVEDTRWVLFAIAQALAAAHRKGIVHRDVRPNNVMWEADSSRVVLLDFGIAALLQTVMREAPLKLTPAGEKLGDLQRMSPEQRRGELVTQQSDVYGLGVLGYELLTGIVPTAQALPLGEVRPDADVELQTIVKSCLADRPQHRPTASDVANALLPQPTGPLVKNTVQSMLEKFSRRRLK